MDPFQKHEAFEMLVLETLNSARIMPGLVFGGGTMLRLCHGLDRYSVDLDFYLRESGSAPRILAHCIEALGTRFRLSDQADKRNTFLIEIASPQSPRRLKIEIRKDHRIGSWKKELAWSPFSPVQVLVNAVTLDEMVRMKSAALVGRQEIRDAYDLEFLVKKGIPIPGDALLYQKILAVIQSFGHQDYSSKLGSIIEREKRRYYLENRFRLLTDTLKANMGSRPTPIP